MRPTFLGFETARKSIMASQKALDITGNNISNINTKGYTRQRLDLFSVVTPNTGTNAASRTQLAGQGVMAAGVDQIRDPYLDKRYRELNSTTAEAGVRSGILGDVENVLDNFSTDNGLAKVMSNFSTALSKFATDSADKKELAAVARQSASQVVSVLNDYSTRLNDVANQTKFEINSQVSDLNATIAKLAELNKQISDSYINSANVSMDAVADYTVNSKYGPNELLDARNVLLDSLSTYGKIDITNEKDGTVSIKMGDAQILSGTKNAVLSYREDTNTNSIVMSWDNGKEFNPEAGSLKGYVQIYNGNGCYAEGSQNGENGIAYFKTTIDQFAKSFAEQFNAANVDSNDPTTARPMFTSSDGMEINAGNLRISDSWLADPMAIIPTSQHGKLDNSHILKLVSVFSKDVSFGEKQEFKGTFDGYISYYSNKLSQEIEFQNGKYDSTLTLTKNVMNSRDSTSGVSMDEEGVNMMNYQKWFNASSRMMTTLDEALDTIINSMGVVGR